MTRQLLTLNIFIIIYDEINFVTIYTLWKVCVFDVNTIFVCLLVEISWSIYWFTSNGCFHI